MAKRACSSKERLRKETLIAMLTDGSSNKAFFENLDYNSWSITSFDSRTRQACVKIINDSGIRYLNITLPYLTIDKA